MPRVRCEMCGKEAEGLRAAIVEGTKMQVCSSCSDFGVEAVGSDQEVTGRSKVTESMEKRRRRMRSRDIYDDMTEQLVPDYGDRVRQGREAKGWSQEDLAKELKEKRSIVSKVEQGKHHPRDDLVDLLEKVLGITLMEKPEPASKGSAGSSSSSDDAMTLGDMLKRELED